MNPVPQLAPAMMNQPAAMSAGSTMSVPAMPVPALMNAPAGLASAQSLIEQLRREGGHSNWIAHYKHARRIRDEFGSHGLRRSADAPHLRISEWVYYQKRNATDWRKRQLLEELG